MSEWKICEGCGHEHRMHGPALAGEPWVNGPCAARGCDCTQFYTDPANFF